MAWAPCQLRPKKGAHSPCLRLTGCAQFDPGGSPGIAPGFHVDGT